MASQQEYRDLAIRNAEARNSYGAPVPNYAAARVYALLAISEALVSGYTGTSVAETLEKAVANDLG